MSKFNHTTVVKVDKILTQNNLALDNFEREDGSQHQLPFLSSPMKPKADESIRQSQLGKTATPTIKIVATSDRSVSKSSNIYNSPSPQLAMEKVAMYPNMSPENAQRKAYAHEPAFQKIT